MIDSRNSNSVNRMRLSAVILAAVFAACAAWAHKGASGVVMERMEAMSAMGKAMRSLSRIMAGSVPYDAGEVRGAASLIARNSGGAMTGLFPAGSGGSPSEAAEEIWADWEEFSRLADRLRTASLALELAAANGIGGPDADAGELEAVLSGARPPAPDAVHDLPAGLIFAEISRTCKTCHSKFRM